MRAAEDTELNFIRNRGARGRRPLRKRGRVKTEILWSADSYNKLNYANSRKKRNDVLIPAYLGASMIKKKGLNVQQRAETLRRKLIPKSPFDIVPEERIYVSESYERSRYEADKNRMLDCCARPVQSDSSLSSRDSFRTEEFTDTSLYSRNPRCRNHLANGEDEATDHTQRKIIENQDENRRTYDLETSGEDADYGVGLKSITSDSLNAVMKAVDVAIKYTHAAMATQGDHDGAGSKDGEGGGREPPCWAAPRESIAVGTGDLVGADITLIGDVQEAGPGRPWEAAPAPGAPPGLRWTRSLRPDTPHHAPYAARGPFHAPRPSRMPPANVTTAVAAVASARPVAISTFSGALSACSSGNSGSGNETETIRLAKVAARAVDAAAAAAKHPRVEKMETGLWRSMEQDEAALQARPAAVDASQGRARKRHSKAGGRSTPQSVSSTDGPSQGDVNVHIRLIASNGVLKAQAVLTNSEGAAYEVPTSVEWAVPSPGAWREVRSTLSAMQCAMDDAQRQPPPQPPPTHHPPPAPTASHARSDQARVLYSHVPSPPPLPVAHPAAAEAPRRHARGATAPALQFSPAGGERSGGNDGSPNHAGDTLNRTSAENHTEKTGPWHRSPSEPIIVPLDISRLGFGVNPVTQQIFVARPIFVNDFDPNSPSFSIPQNTYQSHPNSDSSSSRGPHPSCTFNSPPPGNVQHSPPTEQIPLTNRCLPGSGFTSQIEAQHQHFDTGSSDVSAKSLETHWPYNVHPKGEYPTPPSWQTPSQMNFPYFHSTSPPRPPPFATFWNNSGTAPCLSGLQPRPGYVEVCPPKMAHREPSSISESFNTNIGKAFFKDNEIQGNPNNPNTEAMKFEMLESLFRNLSNVPSSSNEQEIYQSKEAPILPQMSKTEPMFTFSNPDDTKYLNPTRNAFNNNPFISCSENSNFGSVPREETTMFSTTEGNVYPQPSEKYSHLNQTATFPNPYRTISNDKSNFDNIFSTTQQGGENPSAVPPLTTKQLNEFPSLQAKHDLDAPGVPNPELRPSEQWLSFLEAKQAQWWQARKNSSPSGAPGRGSENDFCDGSAGAGFSPVRQPTPSTEPGRVSWLQLRSLLDDMRARNQQVAGADARDGSSADGGPAFAPATALLVVPACLHHRAPPWPPVPG